MTNLESLHQGYDEFTAATARVARGTLAGFISGAIASWVMNEYQAVENRPVNVRLEEARKVNARPKQSSPKTSGPGGDNATVNAAQHVSRALFDHSLKTNEKKIAGPAVHYAYGAVVGALYGGLSELLPTVGLGLGVPYATLLWLLGDEVAVPALGLSKPPARTSAASHASALASHFVYGVSLDIGRRILKHIV